MKNFYLVMSVTFEKCPYIYIGHIKYQRGSTQTGAAPTTIEDNKIYIFLQRKLKKQMFQDGICLRYNFALKLVARTCVCGELRAIYSQSLHDL